jgi:hypothetical protein
MDKQKLRDRIWQELEAACQARKAGNEGQARVCARRAAGWALGPYIEANEGRPASINAYDNLRWLQRDSATPAPLRQAAQRLTARIRPDHSLPFEEDMLADALMIARHFTSIDTDNRGLQRPDR